MDFDVRDEKAGADPRTGRSILANLPKIEVVRMDRLETEPGQTATTQATSTGLCVLGCFAGLAVGALLALLLASIPLLIAAGGGRAPDGVGGTVSETAVPQTGR